MTSYGNSQTVLLNLRAVRLDLLRLHLLFLSLPQMKHGQHFSKRTPNHWLLSQSHHPPRHPCRSVAIPQRFPHHRLDTPMDHIQGIILLCKAILIGLHRISRLDQDKTPTTLQYPMSTGPLQRTGEVPTLLLIGERLPATT